MLAEFIDTMARIGEVSTWTVMLMGGGSGREYEIALNYTIRMNKRTGDKTISDRYSIGRLLDPRDEAIDLDLPEWEAALAMTRAARKTDPTGTQGPKAPELPNGPSIRKVRGFGADGVAAHPERGVLLIYTLDPSQAELGFEPDTPPAVAFGISFPGSNSGIKVEYKANNVLWEQEYGSAE